MKEEATRESDIEKARELIMDLCEGCFCGDCQERVAAALAAARADVWRSVLLIAEAHGHTPDSLTRGQPGGIKQALRDILLAAEAVANTRGPG
jgi:hypothetical protein